MNPNPVKVAEFRQKSREINDFPKPDGAAQEQSEALIQQLRQRIHESGGQITFAEFMSLALYAPGLGYYSGGSQKFGRGGDFTTAPEISPLYSWCLARQCQQVLAQIGQAHKPVILEVGGGSGIMAAEVLAELERLDSLPAAYQILELSAELQQRQNQTIHAKVPHLLERVQWLTALPAQPIHGVVLANEVLDAMPVHRFFVEFSQDKKDQRIQEYYVTWEKDRFAWALAEPGGKQLQERIATAAKYFAPANVTHSLTQDYTQGYSSEINLAADAWVKTIAGILQSGLVLIVDYGFPRHEYYHPQRTSGTLMCHYRHRSHDDPFVYPGLQDITAHVDFTAVAEAAVDSGLHVAGYNTQAFFLLANGLNDMVGGLDPHDTPAYLTFSQQVKTLTLPSEMGELFKVIALTKNIELSLQGFALQDLRNRL